jgi:hypothetical protein
MVSSRVARADLPSQNTQNRGLLRSFSPSVKVDAKGQRKSWNRPIDGNDTCPRDSLRRLSASWLTRTIERRQIFLSGRSWCGAILWGFGFAVLASRPRGHRRFSPRRFAVQFDFNSEAHLFDRKVRRLNAQRWVLVLVNRQQRLLPCCPNRRSSEWLVAGGQWRLYPLMDGAGDRKAFRAATQTCAAAARSCLENPRLDRPRESPRNATAVPCLVHHDVAVFMSSIHGRSLLFEP